MYFAKPNIHLMSTLCLKFQRRTDLPVQTRFLIGFQVVHQNTWGCISDLARKYNVSRPFIYATASIFSSMSAHFFGVRASTSKEVAIDEGLRHLLSLRMEGKCGLLGISEVMERQNSPYCSVGYISETLHEIGAKIGNSAGLSAVGSHTFEICSDEIFAGGRAILITVDPISLLILRIELVARRTAEAWSSHWQAIRSEGVEFSLLVNDEGTSMKAAKDSTLTEVERQSDTFHAVAHRFGLFAHRFLVEAYKAIEQEYDCSRLLANSKTVATYLKRNQKHISAKAHARQAIERYDHFVFLYHCLLESFQVFDKHGNLKEVQKVQVDFDTALQYLLNIPDTSLSQELKSLEACKNNLFTFYQTAANIVQPLAQTVDVEALKALCLAWQFQKNALKAKDTQRKQTYKRREQYLLQEAKDILKDHFENTKNNVYEQLSHIIQSSAAVECINSLLRPYLNNAKNQVTQEFLNLFMFYHNNKCFNAGKRKGKSPMQIATGADTQQDWIELILQKTALN